jgi:hypothetical protein
MPVRRTADSTDILKASGAGGGAQRSRLPSVNLCRPHLVRRQNLMVTQELSPSEPYSRIWTNPCSLRSYLDLRAVASQTPGLLLSTDVKESVWHNAHNAKLKPSCTTEAYRYVPVVAMLGKAKLRRSNNPGENQWRRQPSQSLPNTVRSEAERLQ